MSVCSEDAADPVCSVATAVKLRALGARGGTVDGRQGGFDIQVHEHVPAQFDRLDPLGRVAQSDTWRAQQVCLFLHAAGGRQQDACVGCELQEVQIAER